MFLFGCLFIFIWPSLNVETGEGLYLGFSLNITQGRLASKT